MVTIPGISGREPKEISFKSLAYIIQSRMEEIIDAVTFEVENSGYYDKLAAGIVLTGGGALLRHLPQLVKFKTGLDVRIGYPNEHLVSDVSEEINQPMFSTSIGLILFMVCSLCLLFVVRCLLFVHEFYSLKITAF